MYNIRKGWPSNAAIDEVLMADTGATVTDGMIVTVTDGKIAPANFTAVEVATDPMCAFIIGHEQVRGTYTGLMHQIVIEIDKDHYAADSYAANDRLTAKDGKFAKVTGTGEKVLGRVLKYDAASGLMRVMWHEAR